MVISDFYERFNFFFRKFCLTPVFAIFLYIFAREIGARLPKMLYACSAFDRGVGFNTAPRKCVFLTSQ